MTIYYTSQHIGVTKKNWTLLNVIRYFLSHSKLSKKNLGVALYAAKYILNRISTNKLNQHLMR